MRREDYPANWRKELIDKLEAYPRWKEYAADGRRLKPKDILFRWNCVQNGLVEAFDALRPQDGDNTSALFGIAEAMKQSIRDLDDIGAYIQDICAEFIPESAWDPDEE